MLRGARTVIERPKKFSWERCGERTKGVRRQKWACGYSFLENIYKRLDLCYNKNAT